MIDEIINTESPLPHPAAPLNEYQEADPWC
jgi:hypothetical protein